MRHSRVDYRSHNDCELSDCFRAAEGMICHIPPVCLLSYSTGLVIQRTRFDSQPEVLGVAFFATGPGLGLIMYILSTLEFPTHNLNFHVLTTSVNAKYYY